MPIMANPAETLTALPVDDPPGLWTVESAIQKAYSVIDVKLDALAAGDKSPSSSTISP